jgi:DNA-binding MarR family transcriptional regulator
MRRRDPDPSVTELGLALGLLMRRLRAAAPSDASGLSWTHMAVLSRLANDGPATTAELARAEGMKPQSMGAVVASLEERHLVARVPHPTDGRQMTVDLTPAGVAIRKQAKEARHTWLAAAMARLTREEQATLVAAGRLIKRLAES